MQIWKVDILLEDAHVTYMYPEIRSIHEEGSYTTFVHADGKVTKLPTRFIFRLRMEEAGL